MAIGVRERFAKPAQCDAVVSGASLPSHADPGDAAFTAFSDDGR